MSILVIRYRTKMIYEYLQVLSFLVASPVTTIAMPPHVWVNAGMALAVIEASKNCERVRLLSRRVQVRCTAPKFLWCINPLVKSADEREDANPRRTSESDVVIEATSEALATVSTVQI
jgi:hypothetical protein